MECLHLKMRDKGFIFGAHIGSGGFSSIYMVQWSKYPEQEFIAKIVHMVDIQHKNCYHNECVALRYLAHNNIVRIFKNYDFNEYAVLIMEFCPNGSLTQLLQQKKRLTPAEFMPIARQILEAIKHCHDLNICHLDIKPANILFDKYQRVKLIDFGLAVTSYTPKMNRFSGSFAYLPPEMLNKIPYDPEKVDVWSLGVTFWTMITGYFPFMAKNNADLKKMIEEYDPSTTLSIPENIINLIKRMLSKDPKNRPTITEVLESDVFNAGIPAVLRCSSYVTERKVNRQVTGKYILQKKASYHFITAGPTNMKALAKKGRLLSFEQINAFS